MEMVAKHIQKQRERKKQKITPTTEVKKKNKATLYYTLTVPYTDTIYAFMPCLTHWIELNWNEMVDVIHWLKWKQTKSGREQEGKRANTIDTTSKEHKYLKS